MIDSSNTLIAPPLQPDPLPLVRESPPQETFLTLEQALEIVRIKSYEEGFKDGRTEGYREALANLHKWSGRHGPFVKDKDALGHGSNKRGVKGPTKEHQSIINNAVERLKKAGKTVMATKAARFLQKAEHKLMYVAHKTREIATLAAKKRNMTEEQTTRLARVLFVADFIGGYVTGAVGGQVGGVVGAKIGMLLPSASVLYVAYSTARDSVATWDAAKEVVGEAAKEIVGGIIGKRMVHKAMSSPQGPEEGAVSLIAEHITNDWQEAVFLAALSKGLSVKEAIEVVKEAGSEAPKEKVEEDKTREQKAITKRRKKKEWISAKVAIIMKDGIRGRKVSQAQAVAVANKLWQKKRNRYRSPSEAKAVEVVWLMTGGITVNAERLQYKDTDGEDGLNEEHRKEDEDKLFNPMEVPPIAVWRTNDNNDTMSWTRPDGTTENRNQVYVVDGHKRLAIAKKHFIPVIRAFFIEASSWEEAKKKGEQLNEKMGTQTKAFCPTGPGGGRDNSCAPGGRPGRNTSEETIKRMKKFAESQGGKKATGKTKETTKARGKAAPKTRGKAAPKKGKPEPKKRKPTKKVDPLLVDDEREDIDTGITSIQKPSSANDTETDDGQRDRRSDEPTPEDGGQVEKEVGGTGDSRRDQDGSDSRQPTSNQASRRIPATAEAVHRRLDRVTDALKKKGQHQVADWLGHLKAHISAHGIESALEALGEDRGSGDIGMVQYEGGWDPAAFEDDPGGRNMAEFCEAYLNRHGLVMAHQMPEYDLETPLVSSSSPKYGGSTEHSGGGFLSKDPTLANKLEEAKNLPGLETSEDLEVIHGKKVTHLTPSVTDKLDEKYGKGKWIVKAYGDDAAAGYGIFFPQRAEQMRKDAQSTIWSAGEHLAHYGFVLDRDPDTNKVIGLRHHNGTTYEFNSPKFEKTIHGDARHWADKAASVADHEHGAMLPGGGNEFMAQPAFDVVGVSEADRAAGKTIAPGEGRVHIVTRNGKAEVVPHATWIKGDHLPVVFESEDTKAMAQAAVDAINALPESERQGQIYAPDVLKAKDGYKVVEANPANHTGSSGYLGNNPLVIDAFVSHLTGRTPAHVRFIRRILSDRDRQTKAFKEADHPRGGKGTAEGGKFVSKGGGTSGTMKGKGKGKGGKPTKGKEDPDKPIEIEADLTPFKKGAGASYNPHKIKKIVRERHAEGFEARGQTTENEKAAKRPSVKKKGAYISPNQYLLLRQKAATKIIHIANHEAHIPTTQDKKDAEEGIKKYGGANGYRKTLNGNSTDRRIRKIALATEFGDGKRCGCVYCGVVISYSPEYSSQPMDEDKVHDTAKGGKYKIQNLLPACIPCNRGDKKAKDSLEFLTSSTYGQTHLESSPDNPKYKGDK